LTDIGFTGHKGNNLGSNDIGLIYMNARFYVRFPGQDTRLDEERTIHRFTTTVSQNAVQMIPMQQMDCGLLINRFVLKPSAVQAAPK
jgi:hypothetical protein